MAGVVNVIPCSHEGCTGSVWVWDNEDGGKCWECYRYSMFNRYAVVASLTPIKLENKEVPREPEQPDQQPYRFSD